MSKKNDLFDGLYEFLKTSDGGLTTKEMEEKMGNMMDQVCNNKESSSNIFNFIENSDSNVQVLMYQMLRYYLYKVGDISEDDRMFIILIATVIHLISSYERDINYMDNYIETNRPKFIAQPSDLHNKVKINNGWLKYTYYGSVESYFPIMSDKQMKDILCSIIQKQYCTRGVILKRKTSACVYEYWVRSFDKTVNCHFRFVKDLSSKEVIEWLYRTKEISDTILNCNYFVMYNICDEIWNKINDSNDKCNIYDILYNATGYTYTQFYNLRELCKLMKGGSKYAEEVLRCNT